MPAALRGLCFTCPGAVVASQPALLLPERKGDLHRGHGEKRKSLTGSILTKMNRNISPRKESGSEIRQIPSD